MTAPVVQIYDMSDGDARNLVLGLLRDVDGLTVRAQDSGPDRYVVVECADPRRTHLVFRMVTSIDPRATLIHSTNGRAPHFRASDGV